MDDRTDMTEAREPVEEDATVEAAVLQQLLALHPVQLTRAETVREIAGASTDFAKTDPVERAIDQLTVAGLLHVNGNLVVPSRAALRFYELLE